MVCLRGLLPCNNIANDLSGLPSAPERPEIGFMWLQDFRRHLCSVLDVGYNGFHHIIWPCSCPVSHKSDMARKWYNSLAKNRIRHFLCAFEFVGFRVRRRTQESYCTNKTYTWDQTPRRRNLINVSDVADTAAHAYRDSISFCSHWTNGVLLQAVSWKHEELCGFIFYVGGGVSSYLASCLISTVYKTTEYSPTGNWLAEDLNKGKLDDFYFMLTGIMFVNMGYFLLMSKFYRYKVTNEEANSVIKTNEEEAKPHQQQDKKYIWSWDFNSTCLLLQSPLCCCTS